MYHLAKIFVLNFVVLIPAVAGWSTTLAVETFAKRTLLVGSSACGHEAIAKIFPRIHVGNAAIVIRPHFGSEHVQRLLKKMGHKVVAYATSSHFKCGHIYLDGPWGRIAPGQIVRFKTPGLFEITTEFHGWDLLFPIDQMFADGASLGHNIAACILSGTSDDGAAGAYALRKAGGLIFVQEESPTVPLRPVCLSMRASLVPNSAARGVVSA